MGMTREAGERKPVLSHRGWGGDANAAAGAAGPAGIRDIAIREGPNANARAGGYSSPNCADRNDRGLAGRREARFRVACRRDRRSCSVAFAVNILLCHERFRFRYGVDRVLLLLAREFRSRGHRVGLLGTEIDDAAAGLADWVQRIPAPAQYHELDVNTVRWLERNERLWFPPAGNGNEGATRGAGSHDAFTPDVVVSAGWHFLSAMAFFAARGARVFYSDHGVIPTSALPEHGKRAIALLTELKRTFLPLADGVIAVSGFVRAAEAACLAGLRAPVTVIANGVDHVTAESATSAPAKDDVPLNAPAGRPRIIVLGRFEPHTYKQSEQVFALEAHVRAWASDAWFGVLATAEELAAAAGHAPTSVVALGHPADERLGQLIRSCDLAVSFSRWEGFNLPLAEAQALGRPCLVFPSGAHAEVVADPWLLCRDLEEMDAKIRAWMEGRAPAALRDGSAFAEYVKQRRWRDRAQEYLDFFAEASQVRGEAAAPLSAGSADALKSGGGATDPAESLSSRATLRGAPRESESSLGDRCAHPEEGGLRAGATKAFVMDVTNACLDDSNSGCVRVTRRLAAELQVYQCVVFVVWDRALGALRFPTQEEFTQLGAFQGPHQEATHPVSTAEAPASIEPWLKSRTDKPRWLLLPEIRHREDLHPILDCAARLGLRTAAIFHDAIPVQRPELISDPIYREGHFDYMVTLAQTDVVVANSHASEDALRVFWSRENLAGRSRTCLLPGGFPGVRPPPLPAAERSFGGQKFILCVSSLEPRKNQRRLVESFLRVRNARPDLDWGLILVGRRLHWSGDIADWVTQTAHAEPAVRWLGVVSDEHLADLYQRCEFTVYPSEIEGFGLPILESIWYGRPCLCHDDGVMAELAEMGGCLTANLTEPRSFDAALLRLMTDGEFRERLACEAQERTVKRWPDYAAEFLSRLSTVYWGELARPEELPSS